MTTATDLCNEIRRLFADRRSRFSLLGLRDVTIHYIIPYLSQVQVSSLIDIVGDKPETNGKEFLEKCRERRANIGFRLKTIPSPGIKQSEALYVFSFTSGEVEGQALRLLFYQATSNDPLNLRGMVLHHSYFVRLFAERQIYAGRVVFEPIEVLLYPEDYIPGLGSEKRKEMDELLEEILGEM